MQVAWLEPKLGGTNTTAGPKNSTIQACSLFGMPEMFSKIWISKETRVCVVNVLPARPTKKYSKMMFNVISSFELGQAMAKPHSPKGYNKCQITRAPSSRAGKGSPPSRVAAAPSFHRRPQKRLPVLAVTFGSPDGPPWAFAAPEMRAFLQKPWYSLLSGLNRLTV